MFCGVCIKQSALKPLSVAEKIALEELKMEAAETAAAAKVAAVVAADAQVRKITSFETV